MRYVNILTMTIMSTSKAIITKDGLGDVVVVDDSRNEHGGLGLREKLTALQLKQ